MGTSRGLSSSVPGLVSYGPRPPVLVADGWPETDHSCAPALRAAGVEPVRAVADGEELLATLARDGASAVLLDPQLPCVSGGDLFARIREEHPEVPLIVVTAGREVVAAVELMKAGAFDYLLKPLETDRLVACVHRALEGREIGRQEAAPAMRILSPGAEDGAFFRGVVTRNPAMQAIFRYAEGVAASRQPLLITGETGVGKELLARAVHDLSGLPGEFLAVNVAGLDDELFSDTLFGHVRGAYTGADADREGLLSRAGGGTLLLDEIGDLEPRSQVKLLRLLEDREYYSLGSDGARRSDARIVCATCHDLETISLRGRFRKDLYYRLRTHHVCIPPLRERMEDLPLLVDHHLAEAASALGRKKPTPPPELFQLLRSYCFPGNVRELRAMVFDAVAQHRGGVLSLYGFRRIIAGNRAAPGSAIAGGGQQAPLLSVPGTFPTLKAAEEFLVAEALCKAGNNQGVAASLLGISRETLNKRLARLKRLREGDGAPDRAA